MGAFIQNELLGMAWLRRLFARGLGALGLDVSAGVGGALLFFLYDCCKILILLCAMIFLVSFIQSYFPPARSRRILGRAQGLPAHLAAALLGTVTPFCSCSSIPLFMGFTAAGLPLGVCFSFLISSPMVDLGSLMLLTGVFGWRVAAVYVAAGLCVAVLGGLLIARLHMEDQVEDYLRGLSVREAESDTPTLSERFAIAFGQMRDTLRRVFPYVLLGVGIGAVIHNAIPALWVERLLGSTNPLGVVLAALCGAPMYCDIFGTVPIAEALLEKGALLGVVLAFLMGVTTLSLPSLILLRKAVKPRLLAVFTAICVLGIIAVGYGFNALQPLLQIF